MDRDEILNMPAGRELDALIAERVVYVGRGYDSRTWNTPRFSTDIAAAWEVVGELERGGLGIMVLGNNSPESIRWAAEVFNKHTVQVAHASGPTASLAICRAALLAVAG